MREIKFRGKRIDNNEWVYGNLEYYKSAHISYIDNAYVSINSLGQYTGLHDSKGNAVYEGDILEWFSPNSDTDGSDLSCKAIVYWNEVGFDVKGYENGLIEFLECKQEETVIVIGNIHDNKELI